METTIIRSPIDIAREINFIKSQTAGIMVAMATQVRNGIFEIGKLLCEAKQSVPHGEWGDWLHENVNYSDSTAQNLMRIYREMGTAQIDLMTGVAPVEIFSTLDYSQMVEMLSLPLFERVKLVQDNDLADKSTREIKALVAEVKAAKETLTETQDELKTKILDYEKIKSELEELEKSTKDKTLSADEEERIRSEAVAEMKAKYEREIEQLHLSQDSEKAEAIERVRLREAGAYEKKIAELKRQAVMNDTQVAACTTLLGTVVDTLNKVLEKIEEIDDTEKRSKIKIATEKIMRRVIAQITQTN